MISSVDVSSSEFLAQVHRLDPWWFRFEIDGHAFGGQVPRDLERVNTFFEWVDRLGGRIATILELGSHEGSHSLQLAQRAGITRVVALEGREDNLQRARLVQRVFSAQNIEFHQANLENFDPAHWGSFDAIFCAGLLYHLPEPWTLIGHLAPMARYLFLDTHYAPTDEVMLGRYCGHWEAEGGVVDPLSGLSPRSFWFCFRHLIMLLMEKGFLIRFVRDFDQTSHGPRVWIVAEQVTNAATGCIWSASMQPL